MRQKIDLVQMAVKEIEGWIRQGKYADDDLLPSEGAISEQLEMSRATIRDAIRILEVRGYVERIHGVGVKVNNRSMEVAINLLADMIDRNNVSYGEVLEVRRLIEPRAASLAAENIKEEELKTLEICISNMEKEKSTTIKYLEADYHFHETVAKASGNRLLLAIICAYKSLLMKQIEEADQNALSMETDHGFHRNIYEAIINGDGEAAAEHMMVHLADTEKNLVVG